MGHCGITNYGVDLKRLTDRQVTFLGEYLIDYNGKRAATVAGYKNPGSAACKLLSHPLLKRAIAKAQRQALEECELTRDRVLQELSYLALRDPLDLCDEEGRIVINDLRRIPERIRRCIDGITVTERFDSAGNPYQKIELKLVGKLGAVELAMKHFGMLAPQEHNVTVQALDWERLYEVPSDSVDIVEQRVLGRLEEQNENLR